MCRVVGSTCLLVLAATATALDAKHEPEQLGFVKGLPAVGRAKIRAVGFDSRLHVTLFQTQAPAEGCNAASKLPVCM